MCEDGAIPSSVPHSKKKHMTITFESYDGCKYYRHGNYEFFACRQGSGYSLEIDEWYHVDDAYQVNKQFTRRVSIPYESPSNLSRIRERITEFLNK